MVRASQDQQQDEDYNPFEGDAHTQGGVRQRIVEWQFLYALVLAYLCGDESKSGITFCIENAVPCLC